MKRALILFLLFGTGCACQPEKRIMVVLEEQRIECYEGVKMFYSFPCSTGREEKPTPTGYFHVRRKQERQVNKEVPDFNELSPILFFQEKDLTAIHGWPLNIAIIPPQWNEDPKLVGKERLTSGCVMLLTKDMWRVYQWADIGTPIIISTQRRI